MPDQPNYLDFEISIDRDGDDYVVRVNSLGGRAEAKFGLPFNTGQRTLIQQTLTEVALKAAAGGLGGGVAETRQMKELGEQLFNNLFTAEVKDYYYQCWGQAVQQSQGLRLRLSIHPALNTLPWEFLSAGKEFIALNPQTPVVRFVEQPQSVTPLTTDLPLQILVVIANPGDQATLDTGAEKKRIDSALKHLQEQKLIRVTYLDGPNTWPRLIDALRTDTVHVLHFIGHGTFDTARGEGALLMEDQFGDARLVSSEQLKVLMLGNRHLRLVFLNACLGAAAKVGEPFSSVGAALVRGGIPAVIAMQFEISDRAARLLAETFYESLALNLPVDRAITEARREIVLTEPNSLEWATPVLFMQVADGQLFNLQRTAANPIDTDAVVVAKYSQRADEAFDRREWDRALNYYLFLLAQDPDNEKAKNRVEVIQRLKRQKTTDSYIREKLTKRADEAFDAGNWDQAQSFYKLLLDNDSTNERARQRLAWIEKLRSNRMALPPLGRQSAAANAPSPAGTAQRTCSHCGRLVPNAGVVRFCPHCGKPLAGIPQIDLKAQAAERYQAGDQAFFRGRWAEAAAAYRNALSLSPNYRDAAQKAAYCDLLEVRTTLFEQAKKLYDEGQYTSALSVLGKLRNQDPHWSGLAELQVLCECGQQYQQALNQLKAGNRSRGVELLRLVVAKRPNFLDSAWRLEELEKGGDGLLASELAQAAKRKP
jgi:tetratricopeptide (TPR) repeat protein